MTKMHQSTDTRVQTIKDYGRRAMTPEGRHRIAAQLEDTIRRSRIGRFLLDRVWMTYDFFLDPDEPIQPKLLIGGALLYFVVPTDFIPDFFALFGFTDDIAVLVIVLKMTQDVLAHYPTRRDARREAAEAEAR